MLECEWYILNILKPFLRNFELRTAISSRISCEFDFDVWILIPPINELHVCWKGHPFQDRTKYATCHPYPISTPIIGAFPSHLSMICWLLLPPRQEYWCTNHGFIFISIGFKLTRSKKSIKLPKLCWTHSVSFSVTLCSSKYKVTPF